MVPVKKTSNECVELFSSDLYNIRICLLSKSLKSAAFPITRIRNRQCDTSLSLEAVIHHLHQKMVDNTDSASARRAHSRKVDVAIMILLISVYRTVYCDKLWLLRSQRLPGYFCNANTACLLKEAFSALKTWTG
ncbi:unnamed protein product [Ixodes pacificus]